MSESTRTVGIIPARLASTRLPEKMLANLGGEPMVVVTARAALACGSFDAVFVAVDDEILATPVRAAGFQAFMTDPALPSGTARVAAVCRQIDAEVLINIQGDEPLIDGEGLRRMVAAFSDPTIEMATLWVPLSIADEQNPNVVKVVADAHEDALYFSRSLIPHPRLRGVEFSPRKHIGVYGYRRSTLLRLVDLPSCALERHESLEQLRALFHGIRIRLVPAACDSIGVDTAEDLARVRSELERRKTACLTSSS